MTEVVLSFNGQSNELVQSTSVNPIPVGQCSTVSADYEVDVCNDSTYVSSIMVTANPPNGNSCEDNGQIQVAVSRLAPLYVNC